MKGAKKGGIPSLQPKVADYQNQLYGVEVKNIFSPAGRSTGAGVSALKTIVLETRKMPKRITPFETDPAVQ